MYAPKSHTEKVMDRPSSRARGLLLLPKVREPMLDTLSASASASSAADKGLGAFLLLLLMLLLLLPF